MADIFIEMSKDIGSATCEKMTLGFHKWNILIKPTLANNNLIILLYISSIVVICGNYTIKSMWTSEDNVITKDVMHFQTHFILGIDAKWQVSHIPNKHRKSLRGSMVINIFLLLKQSSLE